MDEGAPESGGVIVKIMAVGGGLNKEKGDKLLACLPFDVSPSERVGKDQIPPESEIGP